jgi:hypothetical protein
MKTKPKILNQSFETITMVVNEIFKRDDAKRGKCDGTVFVVLN